MLESRHATGVASGASRGNRNYVTARGVRDADAAFRACDLAGERPDRGSGRRGGVVSPDLSHRKEGRARMAAITFHVARRTLPVLAGLAVAAPLPGQTSLSIYSDGRVVVRRTLPQGLEKGRNTLTLRLESLDPATLFSPDTSVALVSAALRPPTERGAALESALGQTLSFVRAKGDTVRATVLRVVPPQYRLSDGRLLLDRKSTRLNSSHGYISYAVFCLKKKKTKLDLNTEQA